MNFKFFKSLALAAIIFFVNFRLEGDLVKPYFDETNKCFYNYQGENINYLYENIAILFEQKFTAMIYNFYPDKFKTEDWFAQTKIAERSQLPKVTWLGHATILVQVADKNIITDPVFFDIKLNIHNYMSITSCKRKMQLGISLEELPKIDVILISHMHRDHVDEPSLKFIQKRGDDPVILAPKGSAAFFKKMGFSYVSDFSWWEKYEIDQISFNFLPAMHWSNRGLRDINKCLWGSWMIQANNTNIYFAGDSAYGEHYQQIASQFSNINLALMPIAPIGPREIIKRSHMSAQESVQAFIDLNAKIFVPIHWGTFRLGTDSFDTALNDLSVATETHAAELKDKNVIISKFGQCIDLF